jgi:hypothetical protein
MMALQGALEIGIILTSIILTEKDAVDLPSV